MKFEGKPTGPKCPMNRCTCQGIVNKAIGDMLGPMRAWLDPYFTTMEHTTTEPGARMTDV
jgi:hypothetical protein